MLFIPLPVTVIPPHWQGQLQLKREHNWVASFCITEAPELWCCYFGILVLYIIIKMWAAGCRFRGAGSLDRTCDWNSICPVCQLRSHLRPRRRGQSVAVLAQNKQQPRAVAEGRDRASLDNETEELGLSWLSSPAWWRYQLLLIGLMRFTTRILNVLRVLYSHCPANISFISIWILKLQLYLTPGRHTDIKIPSYLSDSQMLFKFDFHHVFSL